MDNQLKIAAASVGGPKAADKKIVPMSKLLSLAHPSEKRLLRIGWLCAFLVGCCLPAFLFMIGDVFDSFSEQVETRDEKLEKVLRLVGIMGILGVFVFIGSFC